MSLPVIASDDDRFHEECGVFGVFGTEEAAKLTALGLHALQHRGQEASGIVSNDRGRFHAHRGLGHVGENFDKPAVIERLIGSAAIGHNRYATTGAATLSNTQPIYGDLSIGGFALCHNGNLTNAAQLRRELVRGGALFQSTSDTEVIIHLIATSLRSTAVDRLIHALQQVEGAYSLAALTPDSMIGVRDPLGVRPLALGKLGDAWILASESVAFDIINAEFVRDIEPGEVVVISQHGIRSLKPFGYRPSRFCVFEYIYFSRPDSFVEGVDVYDARKRIGVELAREFPVDADIVVPVPDSGVPAALGFAAESGLAYELGIVRSHYIGRTFIQPTDEIRNLSVKMKLNVNHRFIAGKRVVLVDDSIVRGTTSVKIVEMLRTAGAAEVHLRISSPPTTNPCFYGIATPDKRELLASAMTVDEMARHIRADSLRFISLDGLYRAVGESGRDPRNPRYCDACFTGDYPIRLTDAEETAGRPWAELDGGR